MHQLVRAWKARSLKSVIDGHTRRRTARAVMGQRRDLLAVVLADRTMPTWDMP